MELDGTRTNAKIFFINIFFIIFKAATLNMDKLHYELDEVKKIVEYTDHKFVVHESFIFLISLFLRVRFIFGYVNLAADVVALLSIITSDKAHLLLPTILLQTGENIFMSFIEMAIGHITMRYYIIGKLSIFVVFIVKMIIKLSFSLTTLWVRVPAPTYCLLPCVSNLVVSFQKYLCRLLPRINKFTAISSNSRSTINESASIISSEFFSPIN